MVIIYKICRNEIPIVYDGDLMKEEDVLEWLISNKSTGDDDEEIELVSFKALITLVESVDHLAVLFCKSSHSFSWTQT